MLALHEGWLSLRREVVRAERRDRLQDIIERAKVFFALADRAASSAEALSQRSVIRHESMAGALTAAVIGLLVVAWLTIRTGITRPVAELSAKASQVSRGDLAVRFGSQRKDEIGVLAQSIERMVTALRTTISELSEAKAAAEAANRAKSEFLARTSHERKTPLNAVLGYTDLVLDQVEGPINDQQRDSLEKARTRGLELLELIERVLDYAELAGGEDSRPVRAFRLQAELASLDALRPEAESKGLRFSLTVRDSVPEELVGDPDTLCLVLQSLLHNAVKFTERGEVELKVDVEPGEAEGVCLRFAVRDTGPGIPAERQGEIFQAFEQGEPAATREHGGIGLGLAAASQSARRLGASGIHLESQSEKGSCFWFVACFRVPSGETPRAICG